MAKIRIAILTLTLGIFSITRTHAAGKKTVIAHMVNTPNSVRWALKQGANAVELDLRFSGSTPSTFKHSAGLQACDCTCLCPFAGNACPENSVCNALWRDTGSHCTASSSAEDMTLALGGEDVRSKLAVIYIDSKLSNSMVDYSGAGANVVELLNKNTFDRGYKGQVIISGSKVIYTDFLKGALKAANDSKYADKYFYTFDAESGDYEKVWNELLQLGTNRIVYSTGITVCFPITFNDAITESLSKNAHAGVGIWTLDKESSMREYLRIGVDFVMTNKPSVAVQIIGAENLAAPGEALVARSVPRSESQYWQCDCNYHKGGCTISKTAPRDYACECSYVGFWTCRGRTVECPNKYADVCKNPDSSKQACLFGRGDCGGYK